MAAGSDEPLVRCLPHGIGLLELRGLVHVASLALFQTSSVLFSGRRIAHRCATPSASEAPSESVLHLDLFYDLSARYRGAGSARALRVEPESRKGR